MAKYAKPRFRPSRGVWYVTLQGVQHNLGAGTEEEAVDRASELKKLLKSAPSGQPVASDWLPGVIDRFLGWRQKRSAPETYKWYHHRPDNSSPRDESC